MLIFKTKQTTLNSSMDQKKLFLPLTLFALLAFMLASLLLFAQEQDRVKQELFRGLDATLQQARQDEVPMLSPTLFAKTLAFYQQAEKDYQKDERLSKIRQQIKLAMQALKQAIETSKISAVALAKVLETRKQASQFEFIRKVTPKKFARAERDYQEAIRKAEKGDIHGAKNKAEEAIKKYREAALAAVDKGPIKDLANTLKNSKKRLTKKQYATCARGLEVLKKHIQEFKKQPFAITSMIWETTKEINLLKIDLTQGRVQKRNPIAAGGKRPLAGQAIESHLQPSVLYQRIEELSNRLPPVQTDTTLVMGTFDARTGNFEGLVTSVDHLPGGYDAGTGRYEKPRTIEIKPTVSIRAVNVRLLFRVVNGVAAFFKVEANGVEASPSPGETYVVVNFGEADKVQWNVSCGERSYSDNIMFRRPPVLAVGVIIIPALPIALVYEPPQDNNKQNYASYSTTESFGTSVSTSFSEEESTTRPIPTEFSDLMGLKKTLNFASTVVSKFAKAAPDPTSKAIFKGMGTIFGLIASGLGEASAAQTEGTKITDAHRLGISLTEQHEYETAAHLGPGSGDRIILLKDVELVWLYGQHQFRLGYLGHERTVSYTMKYLIENLETGRTGLSQETIKQLLLLDPFIERDKRAFTLRSILTEGATSTSTRASGLPIPRFVYVDTYELGGAGNDQYNFKHTITASDLNTTTDYSEKVEKFSPGWLSILGIGPQENKKVMTRVTQSSTTEVTTSETVEVKVALYAEEGEDYAVAAYYDRVFGSFAFREVEEGEPVVSGRIVDNSGRPQAHKIISLVVHNKKFTTRTDEMGEYKFRALTIPQGQGILKAGNSIKRLHLDKKHPLRNIDVMAIIRNIR